MRRSLIAMRVSILLAALALAATACGDRPLPEGAVGVTMYDNGYAPPVARIPVGGRVIFRNQGRNQHHAVALDESWSTEESFGSLVMEPGDAAEVVFDRAGVYPYYCTYHGSPLGDRGMVGAVVVGDVPYRPPGARQAAVVREPSGAVRQVPGEYARIQEAVDAAEPGDLVLVDRGVYHEELRITTPALVLRGVDRNEVILDGDFVLGNGVLVLADGVAIENMTARNYTLNGFYWTAATGYRGSYLTAYNNGDYGIYAFDSVDGLLEHSYASGSPDAGFYVGQCYPCRAVLRHLTAENNALGYSGTNAGGDLYLVSSIWRRNMAGIVPNTLDTELLPPERETTILANLVLDNDNRSAPAKAIAWPAFGHGILVAGGRDNRIERNVVLDHDGYGILVLPSRDEHFWPATDNRVRHNRVEGSGRADLAVGWPGTGGNCFEGNRHRSATPPLLERLQPCAGPRLALGVDAAPALNALLRVRRAAAGDFPRGDYRTQPPPPPQPGMPGGEAAPVRPAVDVFEQARSALADPELPPETEDALRRRQGAAARPGGRLGLLAAYLPATLVLFWTVLSLADLARRREIGRGVRLGWGAFVLLVPLAGALVYLAAGRSPLPRAVRLAAVAGGLALWLSAVAIAALPVAG